MALKGNLAEAKEISEDIANRFHRLEEFVSKSDWIEAVKEQARTTTAKLISLTQTLW